MNMRERLYELRKRLKLTQSEFGEKLGVTGAQILRLEKGSRDLTEQMKIAVCHVFGVNEKWLCDGEGDMFSQKEDIVNMMENDYGQDAYAKNIVQMYWLLDRDKQKSLYDFIKEFTVKSGFNTANGYLGRQDLSNTEKEFLTKYNLLGEDDRLVINTVIDGLYFKTQKAAAQ